MVTCEIKSVLFMADLSFPVRAMETILVYDVSDVAKGSTLNQVINGELRHIAF